MKLQQTLAALGADRERLLSRFMGNEALFVKFLKKFPADEHAERLREAVAAKEYAQVEFHAHAVKGVCGNLELTELYRLSSSLVKAVRAGDFAAVEPLFGEFWAEWERVVAVLAALDE